MFLTTTLVFCLLAINNLIVQKVQALKFIEIVAQCTTNSDGFLTSSMFSASESCLNFGSSSLANGCDSGTFTSYNSTDCTGNVLGTIQRDTCSNGVLYRCSSYADAEYLRQTIFETADGHGTSGCTGPLKIVSFARLDFCYPGNQPGSLGFIYEKANATAWHATVYNDAACTSANRTQEGKADGTCQSNFETDFFTAPAVPSASPSQQPTPSSPSVSPSAVPTRSPTQSKPTSSPSAVPSKVPTHSQPTSSPSAVPSKVPTHSRPTSSPSRVPSKGPTVSKPTPSPSLPSPTSSPSNPTSSPSSGPTRRPTRSSSGATPVQSAGVMSMVTMLVAVLVL